MIMARIKIFKANAKPCGKVSAKTIMMNNVHSEFLVKFKLHDAFPLKNFHINCLRQVGIEDPFPDDHTKFQKSLNCHDMNTNQDLTIDDLVYPFASYAEESPACIWIPRIELMFKLMRACLGVTDEKDLWMFKEPQAMKANDQ